METPGFELRAEGSLTAFIDEVVNSSVSEAECLDPQEGRTSIRRAADGAPLIR